MSAKWWQWLCLVTILCGCQDSQLNEQNKHEAQQYQWSLVTSWPQSYPGFGRGSQLFAELVSQMSDGRLTVSVYGAGQRVEALEVFDAVSDGRAQMGHSVSSYWQEKIPGAAIFTSVPFGMNAKNTSAWLNDGGGLELWRKLYAPYGVLPFPGGGSDQQMGGWFNQPIESLDDFQNMRIRIPGLGAKVLQRAGAQTVQISGEALFAALKTGQIDAAEWVGPYNDLALGLHHAAKYYYYPGWQEPGTTLEFLVNQSAFEALPADLQAIVTSAMAVVNSRMLDEYVSRNTQAYQILTQQHDIDVRPFSGGVLKELYLLTEQVLAEEAKSNEQVSEILDSYQRFSEGLLNYSEVLLYVNQSKVAD